MVKCYRLDKFLCTKFGPNLCQYTTVNSEAAVLQLCSLSFVLFHSIGFLFIYWLFVKVFLPHLYIIYSIFIVYLQHTIQGDSGGICNTLGNDSMCDSKQKSTYEHGSDFERLPRYGKKKIRTILRA